MSSDLYVCDEELQFFPDPFFDFDTSVDIFQTISNTIPEIIQSTPIVDTNSNNSSINKFPNPVISSSPPCHQLENLSLYQLNNVSNETQVFGGYEYDGVEIKNEECQVGHEYFLPHSYSGAENVAKYFQRSYSSNNCSHGEYVDNTNNNFIYQPSFNALMGSPDFQNPSLSSPENCFFGGQMRKVCSTGDLQNLGASSQGTTQRSFSSPSATEGSLVEDGNFKVGRYSAEERKEKIMKYRAKRNQRNFNKTIKYACRKTLADNRPRIRGRFARNDEAGELPKAACLPRDDEDDEFWLGLNEEEDYGRGRGGPFLTNYGQNQFQYHGY